MMSRLFRGRKGFTLIEMCIVMVVSGLIVGSLFSAYSQYRKDRLAHESYEKLKEIESSLALYSSFSKHLPCPSNPNIPISDPGSGLEIPAATCLFLRQDSTPAGTCMDGVCKALGRDTDADQENPPLPDPVLIGGVPYASIRAGSDPTSTTFKSITNNDVLDPWGYQMTYAVSGFLTDPATYSSSHGAISVQTESTAPVVSLVSPPGSALYLIYAHGDNHMGAYTAEGVVSVPCALPGTTVDSYNCDGDATFVSSLRATNATGAAAAKYFDDTVLFNAFAISSLWDFVTPTSPDIYNKNPGFVGIGTSEPRQMLEVGDGAGTNYDVKAIQVIQNNLCSKIGTACWSPDLLAAPKASGLALTCPNTNTPGMLDVVVGIKLDASIPPKPVADCGLVPMIAPATAQSCTLVGQYVQGFDNAGNIICAAPP